MQTLNLILLTALELDELRGVLKSSFSASASAENREVFTKLFNCWCHNPVATLSLCLMAQAYDLASEGSVDGKTLLSDGQARLGLRLGLMFGLVLGLVLGLRIKVLTVTPTLT